MQQRPLGRSGLAVSRLALGTMTWGRDTDADDAAAQLKTFLDAGGNLVDTADVYGDGDAESVIGSLLGTLVPRDDLLIATKAGPAPGQRPAPRRLPRAPAAHAGRVAAPARHRPRRPVAGARVRPGHPAGGDPGRAGPRGRQRQGPLRRGVELRRLADRPGRRLAGRLAGRGRRWSPPRWSTRCWSAASSGRCCRPATALGLGVLPWSPLGRGVLTGKYRHGRPADSRAASPHFERFVAHLPGAALLEHRRGGGDRRRRAGRVAAGGGAGLGPGPARGGRADPRRAHGRAAARRARRSSGSTLPDEITTALDDVSAVPVGYPERD